MKQLQKYYFYLLIEKSLLDFGLLLKCLKKKNYICEMYLFTYKELLILSRSMM